MRQVVARTVCVGYRIRKCTVVLLTVVIPQRGDATHVTLHLHHAFLYIFLPSLHDYNDCLISRFVEDVNTRQRLSSSFSELRYSLLEFNSRKSCQDLTN